MGAGDFHIQVRIANFLTDLLSHTQRSEHRIRTDERDLPCRCKTGCDTGTVLLGNPDIDMLHRVCGNEFICLTGLSDIDIHHINIFILFTQADNLVSERCPGSLFLDCFLGCTHTGKPPSSSLIANSNSSLFGAVPCHAA